MSILIFFIAVIVLLWAVGTFYLRGPDLGMYDVDSDSGAVRTFPVPAGPSAGHVDKVAEILAFGQQAAHMSQKERLDFMRRYMDEKGAERTYASEFRPVDAGGVPAEWVLAPGCDGSRRVLYIHGGAFIAGSPLSHRNITNRFSELTGAAVLAIDYRLMPEHRRLDSVEDCRTAYRWILENGPDGEQAPDHLVVSGDSAGGNLSLSLAAWVRDRGLRAPDAVVGLSPLTDSTLSAPSIEANTESDKMLGPLFSAMLRIPVFIRRWIFVLQNRLHPANPVVSPVFGDLSNLPPTLIQVSEAEMLRDDAYRFVRKARASGTRAEAQSWPHVLHVWHIFYPEVTEAVEAWEQIAKFVDSTR
jgi:acetyl esterase/lipase